VDSSPSSSLGSFKVKEKVLKPQKTEGNRVIKQVNLLLDGGGDNSLLSQDPEAKDLYCYWHDTVNGEKIPLLPEVDDGNQKIRELANVRKRRHGRVKLRQVKTAIPCSPIYQPIYYSTKEDLNNPKNPA